MMAICKSPHWEVSDETDYGMGTGHLMATVALIYDTTYDLLTDAQREIVRHRLWLAADRMYNYGFNEFKKLPKRLRPLLAAGSAEQPPLAPAVRLHARLPGHLRRRAGH